MAIVTMSKFLLFFDTEQDKRYILFFIVLWRFNCRLKGLVVRQGSSCAPRMFKIVTNVTLT